MFAAAALLLAIDGEARRAPLARTHHYLHGATTDWKIQEAGPEAVWPPCYTVGTATTHSGLRMWANSDATGASDPHSDILDGAAATGMEEAMQPRRI